MLKFRPPTAGERFLFDLSEHKYRLNEILRCTCGWGESIHGSEGYDERYGGKYFHLQYVLGMNNGVRGSLVYFLGKDNKAYFSVGSFWQIDYPVFEISNMTDKFCDNLRRIVARTCDASKISDVPGFYLNGLHKDGWYSSHPYAIKIQGSPSWAPDAQAWKIKKGVYISYPDQSYRFVTTKLYYDIETKNLDNFANWPPRMRQGDCLIFEECISLHTNHYPTELHASYDNINLGRHEVHGSSLFYFEECIYTQSGFSILHPEHDRLDVPKPNPERGWRIQLAPGTSRPFQRTEDQD